MGPSPVPRVFIVRHGETEWSLNGRHTGTTDIPLTANGEKRVLATGRALVGADRLITASNLAAIYVSPRQRAQKTLRLLLQAGGLGEVTIEEEEPTKAQDGTKEDGGLHARVVNDIREWDYGEYEGRTSKDIRADRLQKGLGSWDIWRDGCPGGESPEQITARLDRIIELIRRRHHAPAMRHAQEGRGGKCPSCDVLVVAHGHILRAFAARWIGKPVEDNPGFILEAGGVGTLSYEHHSIDEPAILLGGAFVVD